MKNIISKIQIAVASLLIVVGVAFLSPKEAKAGVQVSVGFDVFYNDLESDGSWVQNSNYGYVWVPAVGADFVPYATRGHWVFTEYGWTWVSDYRWGWATFHYGRWYPDPMYGWIWVPGNQWGPAWVVWSSAPGYYGWAPMEPGWDINVVFVSHDRVPVDRWIFVSDRDIGQRDLIRHVKPRSNNVTIVKKTVIINKTYVDKSSNTTYISGPDRNDVEKKSGKRIQALKIRENDKPGQNVQGDELAIYRPLVEKQGSEKARPRKVITMQEVKPIKDRQDERESTEKKTEKKTIPENNAEGRTVPNETTPNNDLSDRTRNSHHSEEQAMPLDNNSATIKRGDAKQPEEPSRKDPEDIKQDIKNQEALGILPEQKPIAPAVKTKPRKKSVTPRQRVQENKPLQQKSY